MALVTCRECGAEVSSEAKTCPHCGIKSPRDSGGGFWVWCFVILAFLYTFGTLKNTNTVKSPSSPTKVVTTNTVEPFIPAVWKTSSDTDKISGKVSYYARTASRVAPMQPMSFPYDDVTSSLNVACDSEDRWAYVYFSHPPNIIDDETQDGYNLINARVKWGDAESKVILTQDWGSKFLHFDNGSAAITNIRGAESFILELSWHGQGKVYWKYDLTGSSEAIQSIFDKCNV